MKISLLLILPFLLAACVPEKVEEKKVDSVIQQEIDLHKQRMQGFGDMDESSKNGFFGEK